MNKEFILKTLVGSRAHGLADKDSDWDYRGVYVEPTQKILSLGYKYKGTHWIEGESKDNTAYEIGHFLKLATKCNPSILEVFKAPSVKLENETFDRETEEWNGDDFGQELKELFPYVWNPNDAFNAFVGYSNNQRKKFLDNKNDRANKFASAYLRTIYNLEQLLYRGDFSLDVTDNPYIYRKLLKLRSGDYTIGSVIDEVEKRIERCKELRDKCKHEPDLKKVNDFLLKVRKEFWV